MGSQSANGHSSKLRYIDLFFDNQAAEETARELVYRIQPKWREGPGQLELTRFTDGITNVLLKITKPSPGTSQDEVDRDAILMRAYGNNTEILIDRDREATSHGLCAQLGLAPPLLARFNNGLLYRFIPGQVCTAQDLIQEKVWHAVARRLGEWHARLPIDALPSRSVVMDGANGHQQNCDKTSSGEKLSQAATIMAARRPEPNIWLVMQRWVDALPCATSKQQARKDLLQKELERSFDELDNAKGPGNDGLVFGHCDLLSANVIVLHPDRASSKSGSAQEVAFIDYEYAVPCAAAFDIANHFAEWGGYDCDYNMLPTRSIRREFLTEYLIAFNAHSAKSVPDNMLETLITEVDRYRGMPGLYWGIWALIQATISQIDFDYASYAEVRLGEYWAWRAEENGSRDKEGVEMPLRERRWAES